MLHSAMARGGLFISHHRFALWGYTVPLPGVGQHIALQCYFSSQNANAFIRFNMDAYYLKVVTRKHLKINSYAADGTGYSTKRPKTSNRFGTILKIILIKIGKGATRLFILKIPLFGAKPSDYRYDPDRSTLQKLSNMRSGCSTAHLWKLCRDLYHFELGSEGWPSIIIAMLKMVTGQDDSATTQIWL